MIPPRKLTPEEIAVHTIRIPDWKISASTLTREFKFPNYMAGVGFANSVARSAETLNHHPDLLIGWRRLRVDISTHGGSGLTDLDFRLAEEIDRLCSLEQ